jgi:hypothetical protein
LIELPRLNFVVVRSYGLKRFVFWALDQATREALVGLGAGPGRIYTAAELSELVNRRVTAEELPLIHAAQQRLNGRVTGG